MKPEKCFLFDGCKGRTASCYSLGPTDDGCPVYRWFRALFRKEPVPVERGEKEEYYGHIFICPDCRTEWLGYQQNGTHAARYCPGCGRAVKKNADGA